MTTTPQPLPGREADLPPEACATHEICVKLLVRVTVTEGIEAHHLFEYAQALLGGREHERHEDIFDELENAAMLVIGQDVTAEQRELRLHRLAMPGGEAAEEMLDAAESPALRRGGGHAAAS